MQTRTAGSVARLVDEAAGRIARHSAPQAYELSKQDGLIIDIRAHTERHRHGVIPGAVHIPRTVLEWRVAIDSPWRNPHLGDLDERLLVVCDHGYSSILAAFNLVRLGFQRAGDVIGGFESWLELGLPVVRCQPTPFHAELLPGMGPPD